MFSRTESYTSSIVHHMLNATAQWRRRAIDGALETQGPHAHDAPNITIEEKGEREVESEGEGGDGES